MKSELLGAHVISIKSGEKILWEGAATSITALQVTHGAWTEVWHLPLESTVTLTDRRLIYYYHHGLKDEQGQIRFEWPTAVSHQSTHIRTGTIDPYIAVQCGDEEGSPIIVFRFDRPDDTRLATLIVKAVAKYRLQFAFKGEGLKPDAAMGLDVQSKEPVGGVRASAIKGHKIATYGLPGAQKINLKQ